ncbi:5-(carboxyamino)imidazole ribonucleotide synthase [Gynuella sunshinyii]|uniref:N5-carboxyaminoimidazole ribonucleotide synthase n=1 Tax=Gynuella sunshinyii YC6258 TaxID=1445510 RepID=A0A0C5VE45_9GAMM|nr:5-(carboxyamino)imidazole ribonucleotide synthase [Gynuella sunshinyii]AJQ92772.1 phosphoribosylaminoimidazole carboxylase (NCAIR synthetase) [Gynuella sunshinyii YC6258]
MKIGVVGGGQLGRMMALAGTPLAMRLTFLDPAADACAAHVGDLVNAAYDDPAAIDALTDAVDLVTFEFESVPPETVERIAARLPVYPNAKALRIARDRWFEKSLFKDNAIPIAPVFPVDCQQDLEDGVQHIGLPAVVKTRTLGYDGKGQKRLMTAADVAGTFAELGSVPLILEGFIDFDYEVSCIGVRGRDGQTAFYPLIHNEHRQGVLYRSVVTEAHPLQQQAEDYVHKAMDALGYVGVLTFEFFVKEDQLIANEIAPRVHNSGHWTIEGAETSQFENHLRAIADMPLGSTHRLGHVAMYNIIGRMPDMNAVLSLPAVNLHSYAKSEKPGRKIGHITVHSTDQNRFNQACQQVEQMLVNELS